MAALHDIIQKDATNVSVTLRIIDSTAGTPETGVVWNTSGIDLWYHREGAVKTAVTEATLAALSVSVGPGDTPGGGGLHLRRRRVIA